MFEEYIKEVAKERRVLMILGTILFAISIYNLITTAFFLHSSQVAESEVISERDISGRYGGTKPTYEVKFFTATGASGVVLGAGRLDSNTKIKIFYNPADPQEAKLNTISDLWFPAIFFGIGSFIFFAIDFWLFTFIAPIIAVAENKAP